MHQHGMAEAAILLIVGILAATYLGYPLLVLLLAAGRRERPAPAAVQPGPISVIICAHNEEASIGAKLETVLAAAAEWRGRIEVIVADDGSNDRTAAIVSQAAALGPVRLLRLARGGKAAALARAREAASGDILVFTDADPLWDQKTLPALLAPFADQQVGAVAGEVLARKAQASAFAAGDAWFRRYESAIRGAEDRLFGCVSADGGLYAIRAELAEPVPPDVTDDFFLSTAAVARGRRIAFRPDARVHELSTAGRGQNFRRRLRITVRGLTGLWRRRALLNPLRTGWYALGLLFHKLLRRVAPVLVVPLWLLAGWLAWSGSGTVYLWLFATLTAAAALALLLALLPVRLPGPLRLPLYAAVHVAGLTVGAILFLAGRRYSQWTPQKRI